ncbi:MAG: hypothetical protein QOE54_4287, partial [Streptosporangiaceae bacterium]|nr:hypothetical protein [Streptosporangiaceae bacterium]
GPVLNAVGSQLLQVVGNLPLAVQFAGWPTGSGNAGS